MADPHEPAGSEADVPDRVRRRLDDVFGDVLPDTTRDEAADAADDRPGSARDDWWQAQRPPHHDDRG